MTVERDDLVTAFGGVFEECAAGLERVRAATRLAETETERVDAIIARDIATRYQDNTRKLAELRIRDGLSVDLLDLTVDPTPEWLGQGEHVSFTAPVPERSAKVVTTRRRVVTGQCLRALRAGRLDPDQFRACAWYQDLYERAGLEGRLPSADMAREVRGSGVSGYMFTESQIVAQFNYRSAKGVIPARWRKFFEMVVLGDVAVDRARRLAPCGMRPWKALRDSADAVAHELQVFDPDWKMSLTDLC